MNIQEVRNVLRSRGLVEGRDFDLDERFLVNSYDLLARAAEDLIKESPTVILAIGDTATSVAAKATATVPIVGSTSSDPVAKGYALTIARPGKNITGVITGSKEVTGKRLEIIKEAIPGLRRVAMLLNPGSASEVAVVREVGALAQQLGLDVQTIEVRSVADFDASVPAIVRARAGAILVISSSMFTVNRAALVQAVSKTGLPAIYATDSIVEAGGLMSYGLSAAEVARTRGRLVEQVLKGARPAEMPFEQVTKLELVVNLKTARALGIRIPQAVLLRADRVIQ